MRTPIVFSLLTAIAGAQVPVAPTPQQAAPEQGKEVANYTVVNSAEVGYRFETDGGNSFQYRSAVNYGNGIRLLGSDLAVDSRNGHGQIFDKLRLTTQGLGNDPYQNVRLLAEKNGLYRYNMLWRENDYFNPGLVTAGGDGRHLLDTRYRMQDHSLTLFPQSKVKFFLGSSLSSLGGPGYSSILLTPPSPETYPLSSNVKRVWREYRVGNEFRLLGVRVNWMRGWENFKDDTEQVFANGVPGFPPQPLPTMFDSFRGASPYHGTANYWRVNLFGQGRLASVNGQFSYTAGRRAFVVDESATGAQPAGPIQDVITRGLGQRPVATGNLNINLTPSKRLTISNSTAVYNVRTLGDSTYTQLDSPSQLVTVLFYNYLGIRTVANDTSFNFQVADRIGFMGGYHYSSRLIRSNELFSFQGVVNNVPSEQTNELHAGDLGVHYRPWRPLTVVLSAEVGTNSVPFSPRADRDYHALNGRAQYRSGPLQLSASVNTRYNTNSVVFSSFGSQSRVYAFDGSWFPRTSFGVDAGYTRNHIYSIGGIAYFANQQFQAGQSSVYLSNIHTIYLGVHENVSNRMDWYAGYSRIQDTGDGRDTPTGSGLGSPNPVLQAVQTFPVVFHSPLARVSIRLHDNLRWDVGYQYYGYDQKFSSSLNFRAHTGYTSVSVSF